MNKHKIDFALQMIFGNPAWRDLLRQIRGNEITDQAGEEVAAYVIQKVSEGLTAAVTEARKAAAV